MLCIAQAGTFSTRGVASGSDCDRQCTSNQVAQYNGEWPFGFWRCFACSAGRYVVQGGPRSITGTPAAVTFGAVCTFCPSGKYNADGGVSAAECDRSCAANEVVVFSDTWPFEWSRCTACSAG